MANEKCLWLDNATHLDLKVKASQHGVSMREYIRQLLKGASA